MRALVTGCAGFIGSHLTESLLADGHRVLGVDCFNDNYARGLKVRNLQNAQESTGFELAERDLAEGGSELADECDVIFHLAGEPGVRDSWGKRFESYLRNNVIATQKLLETAKAWPEKRFVYASSSSIYGQAKTFPTPESVPPRPLSPYAVSKLAAENLCRLYHSNFGVDTVILRYFSVYGARQRPDMAFSKFCNAAIEGRPVTIFGDGRQTRDFTFVADAVLGTRRAALAQSVGGEVFNLGGGSQISLNRALELIGQFAGRPLTITYASPALGDVRDTGADTRRAQARLGYEPQAEFEDGLCMQFNWIAEMVHGAAVTASR